MKRDITPLVCLEASLDNANKIQEGRFKLYSMFQDADNENHYVVVLESKECFRIYRNTYFLYELRKTEVSHNFYGDIAKRSVSGVGSYYAGIIEEHASM